MFCCCREKLDITNDTQPAHLTKKPGGATKSAAEEDREKEKAFSEAVTAHPSPAASPVTKPADHAPQAAGHPSPSTNQPSAASATVRPATAPQPSAVEETLTRSAEPPLPVVEETVQQSAGQSLDTALPAKPGPNVSVVSVSASGNPATGGPATPASHMQSSGQAIEGQIEALSQSIERAAERGELKGRVACRGFATQLCDLTSQVRQAASSGSMSESALQNAVARLESVAARLESLAGGAGASSGGDGVAPFVLEFDGILSGVFAKYLALSGTIGGDVKTQAAIVKEAFDAQRQFLVVASKSKAPAAAALGQVVQPVAQKLTTVQDFREKNRRSDLFNHLSAISESIAALGWITVTPAPGPYVKEMKDAGMFYTNRVLKDFKEKEGGQTHVDWVKAWLGTLTELQDYIKQNHTTGVTWNPSGGDAAAAKGGAPPSRAGGAPPPPPPPGPPPPPPPPASLDSSGSGDDSRAALFASLNRGESVTTGLRKVTDDMKTHKNPGLRQGPAPFKSSVPVKPVVTTKPTAVAKAAPAKPPLTELQNKKWVVEYHTGNKNIVLDKTELKQSVYVFRCVDSVIQVKGKVNSIILDSCKKTAVVFDDLVASLEFVNCQSMQGQVTGRVPTISIDKTDGCMIYLSKDSLDTEIVTAKSSEMNILVPQSDGDYKEFALPEQFKTTWNGTSMVTVQTDSI